MSWGNVDAPRVSVVGDGFTEEQRKALTEALSSAVILAHPQSSHSWALRINAAGNLEFMATQGDTRYDVVATLTRAGVWTTADVQTPSVGLAEPGR